jgi:hypothetical protein
MDSKLTLRNNVLTKKSLYLGLGLGNVCTCSWPMSTSNSLLELEEWSLVDVWVVERDAVFSFLLFYCEG